MKKILIIINIFCAVSINAQVLELGEKISEYNLNGDVKSYRSETIRYYDLEHDKVIRKRSNPDEWLTIIDFDEIGNVLSKKSIRNNEIIKELLYEFDSKKNCIKDEFYEAEYDDFGRIINASDFLYDYEYIYEENNLDIQCIFRKSGRSMKIEVEYDDLKNIIRRTFFSFSGEIERELIYEYDNKLLLKSVKYNYKKDKKVFVESFEYVYEDNILMKEIYEGPSSDYGYYRYTTIFNINGEISNEIIHILNHNQNWIIAKEIKYEYSPNYVEINEIKDDEIIKIVVKKRNDNAEEVLYYESDELIRKVNIIYDIKDNILTKSEYEKYQNGFVLYETIKNNYEYY